MAKRPNPELVSYIEMHLSKGFKIKNIKRKLAEVGHPIEAIEDAAAFVTQQQPKKKPAAFMVVYGIVLLAAIVLFAWFIITKATQQMEYRETVKEIEERQTYLGMTDIELITLAAAGDMKACDYITGHNIKYACLDKYWERDDCSYEELVGENTDSCYFNLAIKTNNTNLCYNSGSEWLNCLISFNKMYKNLNPPKDSLKNSLFVNKSYLDTACTGDNISEELSDFCLIYDAIKSRNVSKCDGIEQNDFIDLIGLLRSDFCKLFVSYHINDTSLCTSENAVFSKFCAALISKDSENCNSITEQDLERNSLEWLDIFVETEAVEQGYSVVKNGRDSYYLDLEDGKPKKIFKESNDISKLRKTCTAWVSDDEYLCPEEDQCDRFFAFKQLT